MVSAAAAVVGAGLSDAAAPHPPSVRPVSRAATTAAGTGAGTNRYRMVSPRRTGRLGEKTTPWKHARPTGDTGTAPAHVSGDARGRASGNASRQVMRGLRPRRRWRAGQASRGGLVAWVGEGEAALVEDGGDLVLGQAADGQRAPQAARRLHRRGPAIPQRRRLALALEQAVDEAARVVPRYVAVDVRLEGRLV